MSTCPTLLGILPSQSSPTNHQLERQYLVNVPDATKQQTIVRTGKDFQALIRASRRSKLKFTVVFPQTKFYKMTTMDDPRTHTKTLNLVNAFFKSCNDLAQDQPWWPLFLSTSLVSETQTRHDEVQQQQQQQQRQQAQQWNQYFTRTHEAQSLVNVALTAMPAAVSVLMEPAAGTGNICNLFPAPYKRITFEVDPELCSLYGWTCADFLSLTRDQVDNIPPTSAVCVVTNPPFVAHGNGGGHGSHGGHGGGKCVDNNDNNSTTRDGTLATQFIQKSLEFADTVVMLLPARFSKTHQQIALDNNVESWVVGGVVPSRFDLGKDALKVITHRCVQIVFQRRQSVGKRTRGVLTEDGDGDGDGRKKISKR
jgi:hypothetical protein